MCGEVTERFAHRGLDGAGTLAVVAQRDEREHPLTSRRDLDWGPYDALQEWSGGLGAEEGLTGLCRGSTMPRTVKTSRSSRVWRSA